MNLYANVSQVQTCQVDHHGAANVSVSADRSCRHRQSQQQGHRDEAINIMVLRLSMCICIQVGVKKALQLAAQHQVPFIGVHHLEAHALMARQAQDIAFPFLCLLVSGGHCLLLVVHGVGNYTLLGSSLDDAVGASCLQLRLDAPSIAIEPFC